MSWWIAEWFILLRSELGQGYSQFRTGQGRLEDRPSRHLPLGAARVKRRSQGYTNGREWLCTECYEKFSSRPDFFSSPYVADSSFSMDPCSSFRERTGNNALSSRANPRRRCSVWMSSGPNCAGFVAREENYSPCPFGVALEHLPLHLNHSLRTPPPVQEERHSGKDDSGSPERLRRPGNDHVHRPRATDQNVNCW
jgi:hypothetical protein